MSFIAGDIMIRMAADVASLRTDMDKAKSTVGDAVDVMKKAAGLLAGAFSAQMFVGWLKGAIDAADQMSDLSQRTGIAVEDIAGLQLAFKFGGVEAGAFSGSIYKLSKAAVEGNDGLKQLGIETRNADGSLRSVKDVLYDTADAFSGVEDGTAKSALAMEIFGKSGAELLPMLNMGSDGLRELDEMAQKLGLTMSSETADAAGKFNDTLDLLLDGLQGIGRQVAAQILPTLNSLGGVFLETMTSGDTLRKVADGLAATLKLLYSAGVLVVEAFSTVGKTIGAAAAQVMAVMSGDFKGAMNIGKEYAADIKTSWGDTAKTLETVWSNSGGKTVESMVNVQRSLKQLTPATKEQEEAAKKAAEATKKHAEELDKMAESIRMENAGLSSDFLRKVQQLAELRKTGRITVEEYDKALQSLIEKQPVVKAQMEAERKELELLAARQLEAIKNYEAQEQKMDAALKSAEDLIGGIERETSALKMSNTEREISNALLALEKAGLEKGTYAYEQYAEKIKAAVLDREAVRESIEKTKEIEAEWRKATDNITNGLTDALMRGFESGKGFAENLKDYIKNAFKTLVADFVIRPVMAPISGALASVFSGNAMAGTGGGAGSLFSSIGNFFNGSTISNVLGNAGAFGADALGNFLVNNTSGALNSFGSSLMGNAGMIGNAAGMLGNAFAGYGIGSTLNSAISGKYEVSSGFSTFQNIGTAVASAIAGPIGGAIVGAVSGLVNRAFGRGPKEIEQTGITGTIGGGDVTGQSFADWVREGGWFRSDRRGTDFSELDKGIESALDAGAVAVLRQTEAWATALKLPAETLSQITSEFRITLTGNAEEDRAAIESALTLYQEALVQQFDAILTPFQKAGETLAETLSRLAAIQMVSESLNEFGGIFSAIATSSIDARENIIALAGGIDQLMQKAGQFVQDYYSEPEKFGMAAAQAIETLQNIGLTADQINSVASREDFRTLVESLGPALQSGDETAQQQLVALLNLAPQFTTLADYLEQSNLTLEDVAKQAPAVAILDQMLPEQENTTQAVADVADKIDASNRALTDIADAVKTGNLTIARGLSSLSTAQDVATASQDSGNSIAARMAQSLANIEAAMSLNAAAPAYSYDIGSSGA